MAISFGSRNIAIIVGLVLLLCLPLAGVAYMRAFNAFLWICLVVGSCAFTLMLSGFRRVGAPLVPLMMISPGTPVAIWLALDPSLSGITNWRPLLLVYASGAAGWMFAHLSPAIAGWRADRLTYNAIRHARTNIETLIAEWGDQIARPYAPRADLPARVKNLK